MYILTMTLISMYKEKKRQWKFRYNTKLFIIKTWILTHFIGVEDLEEYCIYHNILHDYYNEPPEDDYWNDRD